MAARGHMDEVMGAVFAAYDDLRVATTVLHALRPGGASHTGVATLHAPGHASSQPYGPSVSRLPPSVPGTAVLGAEADRLQAALERDHGMYAGYVRELARRGWTLVRRVGVWTVLADGEVLAVLVPDAAGAMAVECAEAPRLHVDGEYVHWTPSLAMGGRVDDIDCALLRLYSDALGRRVFANYRSAAVDVSSYRLELLDGRILSLEREASPAVHPDSRSILLSALPYGIPFVAR